MKILTFGEILLRLKAPGKERFFQSGLFEATFGGGEANVAVSLANYGEDVCYLTVLPDNPLGDACIRELRGFGVDTSRILRRPGRLGIYFLEAGANQLPSKIVYDRASSAIAMSAPGDINWDEAFRDISWFHVTGITPALSESAMRLSLEAVQQAKLKGITVSCDLNYRKNLWKYCFQLSLQSISSVTEILIVPSPISENCRSPSSTSCIRAFISSGVTVSESTSRRSVPSAAGSCPGSPSAAGSDGSQPRHL